MNKKNIIFLLLGIGLWTGCSQEQQAASEEVLVKTVDVQVETVQAQTFQRFLRLVGTVEAQNDVQMAAEVSGRIERYFVQKGERVQAGEAILKIGDSKLQQELARLQAQAVQAHEQYERLKQIFVQDSIGSEMGVIDARATYKQRKAALKSLKVDVENTVVRAPFDAIFNEKFLDVGEMARPGTALFRLIGARDLRIVAGVASRYADVISEGDKAHIWFDFQPQDTLVRPITFVSQSINPDSRTFEVNIQLPPNGNSYKVDMSANVALRTLALDSAIVIGKEYIYPVEGQYAVYTLAKDAEGKNIARQQIVRLGPSYQNRTVIEQGLQPGAELITTGSAFLQDSMRVDLVGENKSQLAQQNL